MRFLAVYTILVYTLLVIHTVVIARRAAKELRAVPRQVAAKFRLWVRSVELDGLENVRRTPGFHDEPLKGKRKGQRSIRLNSQYRAIYIIKNAREVEFVSVEEITPHAY